MKATNLIQLFLVKPAEKEDNVWADFLGESFTESWS